MFRLIQIRFTQSRLVRSWHGLRSKQALQKALVAAAIGIACLVLANVSLRVLCYTVQIPYYSVAGLTFLARLKFLADVPTAERNQLLDQAINKTSSADVKTLMSLLRNEFAGVNASLDVDGFKKHAEASLFVTEKNAGEQQRFHTALNGIMSAFLWPPEKSLLRAVAADFKRSQEITIPDVVSFLFVTTRFYFSHPEAVPQCESLVTFRGKNADQILAIFKTHSYFRHPKKLSYSALLCLWLVVLGVFLLIAKIRRRDAADSGSYAIGLIAIGLFIMLANCLLVKFLPRYTLPMWELTIVSITILFGGTMESLFSPSRRGDTDEQSNARTTWN